MNKSSNNRNNLGYLGEEFQMQLVKYFVETPSFFVKLVSLVDQNMFTDDCLRRVVGIMKDRYNKIGICPNYSDIELIMRSEITNAITLEQMLAKLKVIREMKFNAVDLITDNAEKFFKQQNLSKAINRCMEILKRGNVDNYNLMEDLIRDALKTNMTQELGYRLFDDLANDLKEDYRCVIPTGATELDKSLYGGLGKGELGVIVSPLGVGKAQPLYSRILTPDGYRTMGEIEIGDYVIGGDGHKHKVIGTFPQGIRPVYRVDFSNGTTCECDIDHLWNVNTVFQRKNKSYLKGSGKKNSKKYFNPDFSFKTVSLREIIEKGLRRKNIKGEEKEYIFNIPTCKPVEFNEQKLDFNPYFLGYYIGDGCYQRATITVGKNDYEEAHVLLNEATNNKIKEYFYEKRNIWSFSLSDELRTKSFEKLGVGTSETKYIPNEYLYNTIENRLELLKGLMDSDGYVDKRGICQYNTKSEQLSNDFYFLVRSLGANATIHKKRSKYFNRKKEQYIDCGISYVITFSFETNIVPFKFKRKIDRYRHRVKYFNQTHIVNVKYIGEKETKCILVDSDEHTYVTEDFIVTHNTSCTTGFAAHAATCKTEDNDYKGYKVLHFYFEDTDISIRRKYYGYVTDIDACMLSRDDVKPLAMSILSDNNNELRVMLHNNLIARHLISGEYSASDIKYMIQQYISLGFVPDLVIVDYFECLKAEKTTDSTNSEWTREGQTMRKLEAIANEFQIAIWVPVQSTKSAIGEEFVGVRDAGGSVRKTQIGHIVITLSQTKEQKDNDKMTLYIGKLRAAKIGRTLFQNVKFNNGTCKFDFSDMDSWDNEPTALSDNEKFINKTKNVAKSIK